MAGTTWYLPSSKLTELKVRTIIVHRRLLFEKHISILIQPITIDELNKSYRNRYGMLHRLGLYCRDGVINGVVDSGLATVIPSNCRKGGGIDATPST